MFSFHLNKNIIRPQGPLKEPQGMEVSEKRHRHISKDNENLENPYFHELFCILSQ